MTQFAMTLANGVRNFTRKLFKPVTIGVRAIVYDDDRRIALVRHSYIEGCYLPGGGVDKGESSLEAIQRELDEELGLCQTKSIELHGVYYNEFRGTRDHVIVYRVKVDREQMDRLVSRHCREIEDVEIMSHNRMPSDVTPGTRRRILELYENTHGIGTW